MCYYLLCYYLLFLVFKVFNGVRATQGGPVYLLLVILAIFFVVVCYLLCAIISFFICYLLFVVLAFTFKSL